MLQRAEQTMDGPHGQYAYLAVANEVAHTVTGLHTQRLPDELGEGGLPLLRYRGFKHGRTAMVLAKYDIALKKAMK